MSDELIERTKEALELQLSECAQAPVHLTVTNNRVRLVSLRKARGGPRLRVARSLLAEGRDVVPVLVDFVLGRSEARPALRQIIHRIDLPPRSTKQSTLVLEPQGRTHDLKAILAKESERAFGKAPDVEITWGRRQRLNPRQRSIRLGTFSFDRNVIRVHRLLDHPGVPAWFVGFVVYHELLHYHFGAETRGARRVIHSRQFREQERLHVHYEDAMQWEKTHLPLLMKGRLQSVRFS